MKSDIEKIHSHPKMEEMLGVDADHVIIDRKTFNRVLNEESLLSLDLKKKSFLEPDRIEYIPDDNIFNLYDDVKDTNGYWTDCTDARYSNLRKHSFRCFQDMALMLHIFSCGNYQGEDHYFVVLENVHVAKKPEAELFTMTTLEIKEKFGIDMDKYKLL